MPFVHTEQNEGQHHKDHAEGGRAGINHIFEEKEKRNSHECRCSKTDKLSAGQTEQHFGFDLGKVLGDCYIGNKITPPMMQKTPFQKGKTFLDMLI